MQQPSLSFDDPDGRKDGSGHRHNHEASGLHHDGFDALEPRIDLLIADGADFFVGGQPSFRRVDRAHLLLSATAG